MALEKTITNSILKYLNSIECCIAEKVAGGAESSGRPDINGCYKGQSFRIEVKTPDHKNRPTTKQLVNLMRWMKSGSIVMVIYSLDSMKKCVEIMDKQLNGLNQKFMFYHYKEDNGCESSIAIPNRSPIHPLPPYEVTKLKRFYGELYGLHTESKI